MVGLATGRILKKGKLMGEGVGWEGGGVNHASVGGYPKLQRKLLYNWPVPFYVTVYVSLSLLWNTILANISTNLLSFRTRGQYAHIGNIIFEIPSFRASSRNSAKP